MPMTLTGSCRCGAVRFSCASHTPQPYQRCYCTICRKTTGGGGYAINLGARNDTMRIEDPTGAGPSTGPRSRRTTGSARWSTGERSFCTLCGTALWLFDPTWPDLVHPLASAIDSDLPVPVASVHLMLDFKPGWVELQLGPNGRLFHPLPRRCRSRIGTGNTASGWSEAGVRH